MRCDVFVISDSFLHLTDDKTVIKYVMQSKYEKLFGTDFVIQSTKSTE